jgi:hypothetical protein
MPFALSRQADPMAFDPQPAPLAYLKASLWIGVESGIPP